MIGRHFTRLRYAATVGKQFTQPPVIIGGCGRSGTTLLQALLSANPRIHAIPGETYAFCVKGYRDPWAPFRFEMERIHTQLLETPPPSACVRWCEKSPKNILYFDRIIDFFKAEVRLIHIVRDGRDVITSVHPNDPGRFWVSRERWKMDVGQGTKWEGHPCVLTVRYEDLILDLEDTMRRINGFIGEPAAGWWTSWEQAATIRKDEAWFGELRGIDKAGIGRWKKPEYRALMAEFMSDHEAVGLLRRFHYLEGSAP
jgi:hypothetical protein